MKKIISALLITVMILSVMALTSCDSGKVEDETTAATTEADTTAEVTTVETTKAEITTKDPTKPTTEFISAYQESGQSIYKIASDDLGTGMKFTIPEGYWIESLSVQCPSYSDSYGSLTVYLYKWETDFTTTVASDPLYVEEFVDFEDNSWLEITFKQEVRGAGDYLYLLKDAVDVAGVDEDGETHSGGGVGVYFMTKLSGEDLEACSQYNFESYRNGTVWKKQSSLKLDLILGYIPANLK